MRKSSSIRRSLGAGLTTSAVIAAILVAPQSAFAATVTSLTPTTGPAGVTVTAVVPNTAGLTAANTVGVVLTTATTCPSTYAATATTPTVAAAATTPTKGTVGASTTPVTFTVPSSLTLGTSGAPRAYTACIYAGTVTGTSAIVHDTTGNPQYTLTASATTTPLTGASGAGGTITATVPSSVTLPATLNSIFTTGGAAACPGTYTASGTINAAVTRVSATQARMTIPVTVLGTGATATPYTVCLYNGSGGALVAASSTAYSVTLPTVTLSSAIGSSDGGQGITFTSTANFLLNVPSPGVVFVTTERCPTTYKATGAVTVEGESGQAVAAGAGAVRRLANNRLAVTVPPLPLTNSEPTDYMACVYNGTTANTSAILTAARYTSTTVPAPTGVSPNAGPALGGNTITVSGTDFPTTAGSITATLGGVALTNVTPINSTTFTATVPAHSPEANVALTVTTGAGSETLQSAYSFQNTLDVDPNTAPNTTRLIDVTVDGTGFLTPTFGTSAGNARVYLVDGEYNGLNNGTGARTNGPVAECTAVLVISDTQLVCSLQLNRRLTVAATPALYNAAAYAHTPATTVETVTGSRVITAATGSFNATDVGQPITGTGIPSGSIISAVVSPTSALISAAATASTSGSPITPTFGGAIRTTGTVAAASGDTELVGSAGAFTNADVGRTIGTLSGVPAGTTITAVSADGRTATISEATTGTVSGAAPLHASSAVPNGAYTLTFVSNGDVGAVLTDDNFDQSVVSSSATFTVAPF